MADAKKSSVHRLMATEMGHIAEQATYDFYKDEGLEEYEYLATLGTRTCGICGGLDGKHFKVSEAKPGVNCPLIHPYCRCTTIPYIPDLPPLETRWERDSKTGKGRIVNYQTYDQWAGKTDAPKVFNPEKVATFAKKATTGISTGFTSSGFVAGPIPGGGDGTDLTYDEERAMRDYVSPAAYGLNDSLRNDYPLTERQQVMVANLDKALNKLPLYTDEEPLNRSLTFRYPEDEEKFIEDAQRNGYIQEKSYASATQHGVYDPDDRVRIVIKKSHSARDLSDFTLP